MAQEGKGNKTGSTKDSRSGKRGLGKGLNALITADVLTTTNDPSQEQVRNININEISPNQDQPRKDFDPASLEELAQSIESNGIVQPLLVVANQDNNGYMIVAGERRWRAARMVGLKEVPAIVRKLDDQEVQRISLIENINREDLNQIEEALAFHKLLEDFKMTQEQLAKDIGRSRPAITNSLRLLKLPQAIQDHVRAGELSAGHARALLALESKESMLQLAETIIEKSLTVRETERAVQARSKSVQAASKEKSNDAQDLSIKGMAEQISKALGTKVRFSFKQGKGSITIPYKNLDDLNRLLDRLGIREEK